MIFRTDLLLDIGSRVKDTEYWVQVPENSIACRRTLPLSRTETQVLEWRGKGVIVNGDIAANVVDKFVVVLERGLMSVGCCVAKRTEGQEKGEEKRADGLVGWVGAAITSI